MRAQEFKSAATIKKWEKLELSESDAAMKNQIIETALGISRQELFDLKERIKKMKGCVRVFVHPNYNDSRLSRFLNQGSPKEKQWFFDKYLLVKNGATKHVANSDKMPVFIFEEYSRIGVQYPNCFIIPTAKDDGRISNGLLFSAFKNTDIYKEMQSDFFAKNKKIIEEFKKGVTDSQCLILSKKLTAIELERELQYQKATSDAIERLEMGIVNSNLTHSSSKFEKVFYQILCEVLDIQKIVAGGMYIDDETKSLGGCLGHVVQVLMECGVKVTMSRHHMGFDGGQIKK